MTRLVTWNINSIRARLHHVDHFVETHNPDILCFQETKVTDNEFPTKSLTKLGFEHYVFSGQKSYNGVAIFSRQPIETLESPLWCGRDDKRHVAVKLENGAELHNFYIPAGGDIPDPEQNDKFEHKLNFMSEVRDWFKERKADDNRFILVGDLNVAPLESDVWSHKQLLKVVSHTPIETALMQEMMDAHDWVDAMRHFIPEPEPIYSWWSYRARDWRKSNKGRRLDHVWVTPALKDTLKAMQIDLEARDREKPSDHAPVIVDFDF
ncbi:exodeoxyribonuclease III [Sneathiella sp. P13V-1]|uniref:exodeoxyribonuclease III n=1 Tax=Sneathiella sp. P13V-1 TaxID=2697366 RepID=UPI00187BC0CB|nr:exodeoxyribonuclease III [Sneathiella sp. P13V-1]MBE7636200.1 exodeoxyribonuclease III [Sneathiella sp. P13V-1]